jgi:hypothetical protein
MFNDLETNALAAIRTHDLLFLEADAMTILSGHSFKTIFHRVVEDS